MNWVIHNGKRVLRISAGVVLLIVGVALGPVPVIHGWPFVLAGLAVLAIDFVWARRLKDGIKNTAKKAVDKIRNPNGGKAGEKSGDQSLNRP